MRQQNYFSKLILVIFLIVIISQFSLAQTTITPTESSDPTSTETNNEGETNDDGPDLPTRPSSEESEIPKTPEEILKEADRATREGLSRGSEISEVESIILPTPLQKPTKFIFGIKDSKEVSLEKLIVLVGLFVVIFTIFLEILEFSTFENTLVKTTIAFIPLFLASLFGALNWLANLIMDTTNLISIFNSMDNWKIIIWILIAILIFIPLRWLLKEAKHSSKVSSAKAKGQYTRSVAETGRAMSEAASE